MNLSLPNDREFAWKDGTLWCENVPLKDLAARFGTPLYVYSKRAIVTAFQSYQKPLEPYKHLMCFAVKANSNLSIIRLLGDSEQDSISSPRENCVEFKPPDATRAK